MLEVSATDPHGRKAASSLEFAVSAPSPPALAWNYRDEVRMELQPDRPEYAPGRDGATAGQGPFQRRGVGHGRSAKRVLRSFSTRLEGNAPVIEIPIERGDSPNVLSRSCLARGSEDCPREVKEPEYRVGYCLLPVRDPASRLTVSVGSAAANYLPAQPVEVTVNINDISNAPVAGAEVTLYAVDEGILSLGDPGLPDPARGFLRAASVDGQFRHVPAKPAAGGPRNRAGSPTRATREEEEETIAVCGRTSSPARFGARPWSPARKALSPPSSPHPTV